MSCLILRPKARSSVRTRNAIQAQSELRQGSPSCKGQMALLSEKLSVAISYSLTNAQPMKLLLTRSIYHVSEKCLPSKDFDPSSRTPPVKKLGLVRHG